MLILSKVLSLIEKHDPDLYEQIEKATNYPDNDDFPSGEDYNVAVDTAEFNALIDLVHIEASK